MTTPDVSGSLALYQTAAGLKAKGRYAGAAQKFGDAAAAAAQELAAKDCLVVAFLRASRAQNLHCHSLASTLPAAEVDEARETIKSVLLPPCVSTLTRRKAAGTLLPGSLRAAEVAWFRALTERSMLGKGHSPEVARAGAEANAPTLGCDAYFYAAAVAVNVLGFMKPNSMTRELQLSHAAFVASALELMAQPCELPSSSVGDEKVSIASSTERYLAQCTCRTLLDTHKTSKLDGDVLSLIADAWGRVERSGAIDIRKLVDQLGPTRSVNAALAAAAAEGAVRGLRECALAGCASKEVHVSQFKRCGACQQAFYCCREHQLADWPAHKAACKAARKAADPSSDE